MGGQESFASGAANGAQVVIGTGFYTSLSNDADTDTNRFLTAWEGKLGGVYTILGQLNSATLGRPVNFSATDGDTQVQLAWKNPADPHFTGTTIRVKTTGFPTSATDGTLVVDKAGAPNVNDTFSHTGLTNWTTYYYAAFAHDSAPNFSPRRADARHAAPACGCREQQRIHRGSGWLDARCVAFESGGWFWHSCLGRRGGEHRLRGHRRDEQQRHLHARRQHDDAAHPDHRPHEHSGRI
jgi:hypothetical protein